MSAISRSISRALTPISVTERTTSELLLEELVEGVEILGDPVGGAEILTGIGTEMVDGLLGDLGS